MIDFLKRLVGIRPVTVPVMTTPIQPAKTRLQMDHEAYAAAAAMSPDRVAGANNVIRLAMEEFRKEHTPPAPVPTAGDWWNAHRDAMMANLQDQVNCLAADLADLRRNSPGAHLARSLSRFDHDCAYIPMKPGAACGPTIRGAW